MRLTTRSEYALLALIFIARHGEKRHVRVEEICDQFGLSRKYLEQILAALKQSRYLRAKRGAGGGYRLARPANRITLAETIRLMDGALAPTDSVSTYFYGHTPLEQERRMLKVMKDIRDYIAGRLEKLTIADVL